MWLRRNKFINSEGELETRDLLDSSGRKVFLPSNDPNATQLNTVYDINGQPIYVPSKDPAADQILKPVYDKKGRPVYVSDSNQYRQPDNSFYAYLEAQVVARNAKYSLSRHCWSRKGRRRLWKQVKITL